MTRPQPRTATVNNASSPKQAQPADRQDAVTGDHQAIDSFRIVTVNVHKGFTVFNRRFILPELRDAVNRLSADMLFLQEVIGTHEGHSKRQREWPLVPHYEYLADTLWPQFAYGRNAVYPDGDHGNALLSKFPIVSHDNIDVSVSGDEKRGLLHAVLDLPGQRDVHAVCVHLGLRAKHRDRQLELLGNFADHLPDGDPVIVAGDFNDWRDRASPTLAHKGFHEAFVAVDGVPAKSFPARWPLLRLDRIYVRHATTHYPQALYHSPWSHLSDHVPLIAEVRL